MIRTDGSLNMFAMFPNNVSPPPDVGKYICIWSSWPLSINMLGPKGYKGTSQATTRLHCDWSHAFNIMCYSAEVNGVKGARWDMFHPSHTEAICRYLHDKGHQGPENPIHQQSYYLEEEDLQRLHEEYGVIGYSFDQQPNEIIFIPAGAPHQVIKAPAS
jgi:[histone H3]-dimethyl-L-lysine9 demethylase